MKQNYYRIAQLRNRFQKILSISIIIYIVIVILNPILGYMVNHNIHIFPIDIVYEVRNIANVLIYIGILIIGGLGVVTLILFGLELLYKDDTEEKERQIYRGISEKAINIIFKSLSVVVFLIVFFSIINDDALRDMNDIILTLEEILIMIITIIIVTFIIALIKSNGINVVVRLYLASLWKAMKFFIKLLIGIIVVIIAIVLFFLSLLGDTAEGESYNRGYNDGLLGRFWGW